MIMIINKDYMIPMDICKVCAIPTRSIVQNRYEQDSQPIDVYICPLCQKLMKGDRLNEIWSFQRNYEIEAYEEN